LFVSSSEEKNQDVNYQTLLNRNYKVYALNIPEELDFAGEKVPIQRFDVRESFDRELLVNTYWQSNMLLFIKNSNKWFPVIEPILKKNGVPNDFKYLALIESGLRNAVSPAGASGFWQFLKGAGKEYGLEINSEVDERYHLEKATEAACKYLKTAYEKFGHDWALAAASYNMGMSGLETQIKRQKGENYYDLVLSEETSRYVYRILAAKEILSKPKKYGFHFRKKDLYYNVKTYEVEVDSAITDMAVFAKHFNINYKLLKYFNPWLRENKLTNKTGKTYKIKIPKENFPLMEETIYNSDNLMNDSLIR